MKSIANNLLCSSSASIRTKANAILDCDGKTIQGGQEIYLEGDGATIRNCNFHSSYSGLQVGLWVDSPYAKIENCRIWGHEHNQVVENLSLIIVCLEAIFSALLVS